MHFWVKIGKICLLFVQIFKIQLYVALTSLNVIVTSK